MADPKTPNVQGSAVKPDVNHPSGSHSVNPRHSAGPANKQDDEEHKKAQEAYREELHLASLGGTPKPKDFKGFKVSEGTSKIDFLNSPEVTPLGAYDHFIGELWPGAFGWLPLDDQGVPSGPATLEPPGPDVPACKVFANNAPTIGIDMLVSASGAPLVPPLNPNPDIRVMGETQDPLQGDARTKMHEQEANPRTSVNVTARNNAQKAEAATKAEAASRA
jgi:hypothetical protein